MLEPARRPKFLADYAPPDYLIEAGLMSWLEKLGFYLAGYGCTTCIGNSGPVHDSIANVVKDGNYVVCSVLSGNRNFEGRVNPVVRANYLASPPLVVAYALAGHMQIDLMHEPIGTDRDGNDVYLRDLWPSEREIQSTMLSALKSEMFSSKYAGVFDGDQRWKDLPAPTGSAS